MISVKINAVSLPRVSPIEIEFLNGKVTIPGKHGAYVVASGCGAGKTTAIKELIKHCYDQGVLYAAFTIEECNEMYNYCRTFLNEDQVILLHSDVSNENVELNLLRNTPEKLYDKEVIICTHHKLMNEYPELFYKYGKNTVFPCSLSHISRLSTLSGNGGVKHYPRQLILIDEMPTCDHIKFKVNKTDLRSLGVMSYDTQIIKEWDKKKQEYVDKVIAIPPLRWHNGGNYAVMEELYRLRAADTGYFFDRSTESGKLKNDLALSTIYDNYETLICSNRDEFILSYTLADQAFSGVESRIIIFDGTGDLTFIPKQLVGYEIHQSGMKYSSDDYSPFDVLTYDGKYNSPISISKFDMGYKRSYRTLRELHDKLNSIRSNIDIKIRDIDSLLKSGNKLLIVTWKDLKVKDERHGIPLFEGSIDEIPYVDYIRIGLNQLGNIEGVNYSIIHYQSGLDKATNQFRDYDSIMFLGEFHVPNNVVDEFNSDYSVCTSIDNYTTYQLVQAVCRTRIRNHKGESINIYFSNDWNNKDIDNLNRYLTSDKVSVVRDTSLSWIKPKWKPFISKLCELNPEFRHCVETGKPYRLEFTLDDIYEIYPLSEKKTKKYNSVTKYLGSLGITLNIIGGYENRYKNIN